MKGFDLEALLPEEREHLERSFGRVGEFCGKMACRCLLSVLDRLNASERMSTPSEPKYVATSEARKIVRVCSQTLRTWGTKSIVRSRRGPTGRWLYCLEDLIEIQKDKEQSNG